MQTNSDDKKVRYKIDCYILDSVLLEMLSKLIITIACYHYVRYRSKQKGINALTIWKWKLMNLKKFELKIVSCYYFDDIIKVEDIDFDNILIDEKSHENILIYDISYKILIGAKPLRTRFDKINGFIRIYDGTRYLVLFGSEKYDAIYTLH